MNFNYKISREKKIINHQKEKLRRREEKFFDKKENEFIQSKIAVIKNKIEEYFPSKVMGTFDKAFEKGFYYVFEKGSIIIEKSYNLEKLKNEADINEYILSKQISNKNLNRFDKTARKGIWVNKGLTTTEGTALGVLGIGLPDIPVFIGVILKTIYEICLNYGFKYDSDEEKAFILNIICASVNKTPQKILYSNEIDRIGYNIDNGFKNEIDINQLIKETSRNLSESMMFAKVIQGMPIVGAYGGISNYMTIRDISEVATIKYKKRMLYKL
ncbi:EcsC family protein [Clostridium sp. C2-6-12]|uniref:EcsC family protein n=1 Tax=Clostridium sp. C2-6-12 TaxID=2698832 RepID=UPI00136E92C0|nr:EcsC family protein [Clostridium sp. C2-6-12]